MAEGIKITVPGPFTLRIAFALTKNGREEIGNLLTEKEFTRQFDSLDDAITFLNSAFKAVP